VGVPPLAAGRVHHARADREAEHLERARHLPAVTLEAEERPVLFQVLSVEEGRPPFGAARVRQGQKKTGSRYAPKTSSIAARISYSVQ
jgi:hypothetical protein